MLTTSPPNSNIGLSARTVEAFMVPDGDLNGWL
jgi:hypothetical protein